jgi:predicted transcriptional regulator
MPATPLPTQSELAILSILWTRGPSTVRDVHASLSRLKPTGYTTVLKFMQIMFEKGLVERDDSQRSHVYRAVAAEAPIRRRLLRDLLDRAFSGSTGAMVLAALSDGNISESELAEIRRLLDRKRKE